MGVTRFILSFLFLAAHQAFGQQDSLPSSRILTINPHIYQSHDTVWTYSGICKPLRTTMHTSQPLPAINDAVRQKLFTVHGNVQYDFIYRSLVDTPFSQKDFAQHTVQTTLDFLIKEQYPVRVTVLSRQSNSPYFADLTDVNVQFSRTSFMNQLKAGLIKQLIPAIKPPKLNELERICQQKLDEAEALQSWLSHPGRLQELVESKEELARRALGEAGVDIPTGIPKRPSFTPDELAKLGKRRAIAIAEQKISQLKDSLELKVDSLKNRIGEKADSSLTSKKLPKDSLVNKVMQGFEKKKAELDSLKKQVISYSTKLNGLKKNMQDSLALLKQQLARINDPAQLKEFIRQHKLNTSQLPKGWNALSAINNIGIGRTWVDYSDLTVKNISLTGVNVEVNPSKFYLAAAAGRINYRFRDFIVRNNQAPRQNLYLLRAGIGRKEGSHLIFTWYDGKRSMLNSYGTTSMAIKPERVVGMSAEARFQINTNNYIIVESAKSSFHNTGTVGQPSQALMDKVWNFKDRSNEAYSIKVYSYWPQTNTSVNGYYRKMGAHFQSFNLQPVNTGQEAYQFRVQQQLFKRRLSAEAAVRKNDFSSPYVNPGLSSKTVFKSIQATLRVPKYPFVSVGYYPSSQLTVLDNNTIVENQYNTLSMVAGHTYRLKQVSMSSNLVALKFYNSGADTGFIYYNASSLTFNQFIFLKGLQLQSGLTVTRQRELHVTTLEQSATYQLRQWLTISGGLKSNRVNNTETLWGATAGLGLNLKKLGTIQGSYEKSYLPGTARNLLPVDMGRLTYYRTF